MTESLIIRHKTLRNFTVIRNELCEDKRLSWKALGLLTYLLHLPHDFKLKLYNLAHERKGLNGRDSTRSGLKELEATGYVKIVRERSNLGRYAQTVWYVSDIPDILE